MTRNPNPLPVFAEHGFVIWPESHIRAREEWARRIRALVEHHLLDLNRSMRFTQIEAPVVQYEGDVIVIRNPDGGYRRLRAETTQGSFEAAGLLMKHHIYKPPFGVWQAGLSFREEQDHPIKNMQYRQFWQQELQLIVPEDTKADYIELLLPALTSGLGCKHEPSDRLPKYSERTTDLIIDGKEIASLSIRNDFFSDKYQVFHGSQYNVFEFAFGLDRIAAIKEGLFTPCPVT